MLHENSHPTDQELLLAADGELSARSARVVRTHLSACWHCRARMSELEAAIVDFVRVHHQALDAALPPIGRSRAQLSARLSDLAAKPEANSVRGFFHFTSARYPTAYVCFGLLSASLLLALLTGQALRSILSIHAPMAVATTVEDGVEPNRKLTPGATRPVSMHDVCAVAHEEVVVDVPSALREKILREYGIVEKRESDFEIDFLIAPRLGGTEDPQNLWPEPYASSIWNARVKDDLEERLHKMVCSGEVSLKTAQNDISADWIGAYKKYFNTDKPINLTTTVDVSGLDSYVSKLFAKMWPSESTIREKSSHDPRRPMCQVLIRNYHLVGRIT
jgi:hypothetical protein